MGKQISLFSGYSQKENRTTNYCLLILKMFYEANPSYFSEVISGLLGYDISDYVGVNFSQQERKLSSIPDGLITQKAFSMYIETKNYDWFYDAQLEKHLESLNNESNGLKILFALGNFEKNTVNRFDKIEKLCAIKYKNKIVFSVITFEDFIESINISNLPKYLDDQVLELRSYLDEMHLLPSWPRLLDVVNCAALASDVIDHNIYLCPAKSGHYKHSRCKYFGMYKQKEVKYLADIMAVIDVESEQEASLLWSNCHTENNELLERAKKKVIELRPNKYPVRAFLLDELHKTAFKKDSSGGMMGSKQYFDISSIDVDNVKDLANALASMAWSDLR